jgi:hypothetical protein
MRILLIAVAVVPCLFLVSAPSSSEPIFILNCRLINISDHLFRQHCKAQDRECYGRSCRTRVKLKAKTVRSQFSKVKNAETPLAEVESPIEDSSGARGIDTAVNQPADASNNVGSGDSPEGSSDQQSSDGSAATDDGAEGATADSEGTNVQDGADTASGADRADVQGETELSSGSDGS